MKARPHFLLYVSWMAFLHYLEDTGVCPSSEGVAPCTAMMSHSRETPLLLISSSDLGLFVALWFSRSLCDASEITSSGVKERIMNRKQRPLSSSAAWLAIGFVLICFGAASTCWGLAAERRPWEVLRFVQQSSKFVSLPFLGGTAQEKKVRPGDKLWSAAGDLDNSFTMAPLDDVVMGGASASSFDRNTGTWSGSVTDANNGGFIGIRSTPGFQWDCSACQGLEWKLKLVGAGEGASGGGGGIKRFKFVLRDTTDFNGITWSSSVDVKPGRESTVKIPFDKLIPARFARIIPDETFRKDNVVGVQLAFSKFEYDGDLNPNFSLGDVKVQLLELRAY